MKKPVDINKSLRFLRVLCASAVNQSQAELFSFSTMKRLFALLLTFAFALTTHAQQPVTNKDVALDLPVQSYVIRNARIITVSGAEIDNGSLVITNGRIAALGANVSAPSGAQEIDARGLIVYPGMIDAGTSLGLAEVGSGAPGTVDLAEVGDLNPNANAIFAINPHTSHVGVTRFNGVTTVLSMPQGGLISGQAAVINLEGDTPRKMALLQNAALVINFPRTSALGGEFGWARPNAPDNLTEVIRQRDSRLEQIRKIMRDAEAYGKAQDAYARDKSLPRSDRDVKLEALVPYVRGERPVLFRADREIEIRNAVRFAEEMKLRPVIVGGNDAWMAAQFLRDKRVPVILDGVLDLPPREDDDYDQLFSNAAKLQTAGVQFCISTGDDGASVRDLPYHAGMAAAFGLPRNEALKAVTLYPAQILGVANEVGSLEQGKLANIVITDGDLLDARTNVKYLFIKGRQVPLTSRHTELYDQFKNRTR